MVRPLCLPQVLQDMVPPKKHLLRHQPANAQIGLMEGNTFCTTLQPRLFTMDLNVVEHKVFYTEVGPAWAGSRAHRRWGRDCREPAVAWAGEEAGVWLRCPVRWGLLSPWSSVSLHEEPCSSRP